MKKPIGLTGGIASGKSSVAGIFSSYGAIIVSGDQIAREVMVPGSNAVKALAETFGRRVITREGEFDRREMLEILLQDPAKMYVQIELLKPFILPAIDQKVSEYMEKCKGSPVIVEAPLLFEYGRRDRYATVVVVFCLHKQQIDRLVSRSGMDPIRAEKIVNLQIPISEKINMADCVIDNSGTLESTRTQVKNVYRRLICK